MASIYSRTLAVKIDAHSMSEKLTKKAKTTVTTEELSEVCDLIAELADACTDIANQAGVE